MIHIDEKAVPGLVLTIIGTLLLAVLTIGWSYPVVFFVGGCVGSFRFR